jgi:hypothetical protein
VTTDNSIGGPHIYYYRSRGSYIIVVLEYIITLEHISWRSVLLVEETGVPGENHVLSQTIDKLYHTMLYRVHLAISCIRTHNLSDDRRQITKLPSRGRR